jgi:hypothetical protein
MLRARLPATVHGHDQDPISHATKLPLRAWLTAFWMQLHSDKGISSVRLAEAVGVTQSTAWRMGHAFRVLMANRETKLGGIVEADDVKIGGKPRKDPANPDARKGMCSLTPYSDYPLRADLNA